MIENKKIRVMHVAQSAGGVRRYLQMLLRYLDHEKFENVLVCSADYKQEDFEGLKCQFEQVDMQRAIGMTDLRAILEVRKLLARYTPDIVYAHSSKAGAIARIARIGMKCKCIYNPHGWSFNMQGSKGIISVYKLIEKLLAPLCTKIVCISEAERQSAVKHKICAEKKLHVIYNGIDIEAFSDTTYKILADDCLIPEGSFVVGTVGRLSKQKAPDIFVRSARLIKDRIPNAFFVMVGNGEQQQEIEELITELKLSDCFLITGWIDKPQDYISCFDVALLLSRWEGFGLVLPEYMMGRKPIVATKTDAIPNIITNRENGLLVEVDDYQAVADAVFELSRNQDLVNTLVENGVACVHERFNAKRVAKETEAMIVTMQ